MEGIRTKGAWGKNTIRLLRIEMQSERIIAKYTKACEREKKGATVRQTCYPIEYKMKIESAFEDEVYVFCR